MNVLVFKCECISLIPKGGTNRDKNSMVKKELQMENRMIQSA